MTLSPTTLFATGLVYLALLFLIAHATDRGLLPRRLVSNPVVYSLSLGVYATSWTYYGSVGLADRSGYAFLTIYLGVTGAFLLGPRLLAPLLALCRDHQLTSIADLLAFRYGGRSSGVVVTLFMLFGTLPYLSLQIQAVAESLQVLTGDARVDAIAFGFCVVVTAFALLFGARHLSMREKHRGLVAAIAFESAVKLIALLIAGGFVLFEVFDSPFGLASWAGEHPDMVEALYAPADSGLWSTLLLLAFSAAFLLPRQYHMMFVENENPAHLSTAYWLFPLYLLLLNLPIVPILFAGRLLELDTSPDFYVLGITLSLERPWLSMIVFLGGLSAASAMMIVTTLALSSMCVNHLLLPASLSVAPTGDMYRKILWSRRLMIALIVLAGFAFTIVFERHGGLARLGLISFVAAAQLLPGVLGLLFWPHGTRRGFVTGLFLGALSWCALLILPLFVPATDPLLWFPVKTDLWTLATFVSLSLNAFGFITVSLLLPAPPQEFAVGELTTMRATDAGSLLIGRSTLARSGLHYRYAMQQVLGERVASEEFARAVATSGIDERETRSAELQLLHDRLERNLTGLLGPTLARDILSHRRPGEHDGGPQGGEASTARLLELRLEASRERMRGLTRQLDDLRRYLRAVLHELPVGVCSIAADRRIVLWNAAMASLTGIAETDARDTDLDALPAPWAKLLSTLASDGGREPKRVRVDVGSRTLALELQRASIGGQRAEELNATGDRPDSAGLVLLVEDRSSIEALESELAHSERLASIGRLAAGVAHEIGNPLTGIASLTQNIRSDVDDAGAIEEQTDDILEQVGRIDGIVQSLLGFARAGKPRLLAFEPVRLLDCIDEALRLVRYSPSTASLEFESVVPADLVIAGDANQIVQVFVNLLNNACHASPAGGRIRVHARVQARVQARGHVNGDDEQARIVVRDDGAGIPEEIRAAMFEPFFTTRTVGEGTGLGLSLVYSIVTRHAGRVRVLDDEPGGALEVVLPLAASSTGS